MAITEKPAFYTTDGTIFAEYRDAALYEIKKCCLNILIHKKIYLNQH